MTIQTPMRTVKGRTLRCWGHGWTQNVRLLLDDSAVQSGLRNGRFVMNADDVMKDCQHRLEWEHRGYWMLYLLPLGIRKRIIVNKQRNNTVKSRRKRCCQFVELLEWNHKSKALAYSFDSGKGVRQWQTVAQEGRGQGMSLLQAVRFGFVFLTLVCLMKLAWVVINLPKVKQQILNQQD